MHMFHIVQFTTKQFAQIVKMDLFWTLADVIYSSKIVKINQKDYV